MVDVSSLIASLYLVEYLIPFSSSYQESIFHYRRPKWYYQASLARFLGSPSTYAPAPADGRFSKVSFLIWCKTEVL